MTDLAVTAAEQAEARRVLETDRELNVHERSYYGMVANWPADAVPVRSETGGILGYTRQSVTVEIERLTDEERGYLDLAQSADSPEMEGAYRAVAQNYRLARMVRETDQAYTAQTFKIAAKGWENLMPDALHLVYMGKSQGMWPHQRAEKDAAEVEAATDRLLTLARTNLAKRLAREELTERAKTMTDAELDAAVEQEKGKTGDSTAFLVLIRERDGRREKNRKARNKALKAPASGEPWTEAEERMLAATASQTKAMDDDKLRAFHARPYSTRLQELQREAVRREMERRGI